MKEKWKDIKGYEGLYKISNTGLVSSLHYRKSNKEQILKCGSDKDGYLQVNLCKNGKHKNHKIHRLVAIHFIENPNNLPQINHKDENKTNNNVDNLEWCTNKYNNNYGTKNDWNKKSIVQLSLDYKFICQYDSIIEAAKKINKNHSHITQCCQKKRRTAYGYIWRYIDENSK